jgi:hypothetical protein
MEPPDTPGRFRDRFAGVFGGAPDLLALLPGHFLGWALGWDLQGAFEAKTSD